MKEKENFITRGHCKWWLYDKNLKLKISGEEWNTIPDAGLNVLANRMSGTVTKGVPSYIAVGTGTQDTPTTATTLKTELTRIAVTSNIQTDNKITVKATFSPTVGTGTLTEKGIFNDVTAGDMITYNTFNVTKEAVDTLILEWDITFSRS